ncbi:MAG: hypothetical protein D6769_01790, partial [Methanobacteriota archaeon]
MIELNLVSPFISILAVLFPGMLASLALFKDRIVVERLALGAFVSYVAFQLLGAFTLFVGIPFSTTLVYVLLLLIFAIAVFLAYKQGIAIDLEKEKNSLLYTITILLVLY